MPTSWARRPHSVSIRPWVRTGWTSPRVWTRTCMPRSRMQASNSAGALMGLACWVWSSARTNSATTTTSAPVISSSRARSGSIKARSSDSPRPGWFSMTALPSTPTWWCSPPATRNPGSPTVRCSATSSTNSRRSTRSVRTVSSPRYGATVARTDSGSAPPPGFSTAGSTPSCWLCRSRPSRRGSCRPPARLPPDQHRCQRRSGHLHGGLTAVGVQFDGDLPRSGVRSTTRSATRIGRWTEPARCDGDRQLVQPRARRGDPIAEESSIYVSTRLLCIGVNDQGEAEGMTFLSSIARHVRHRPDAEAISDGSTILSWAELDAEADRIAWAMSASAIGEGDRVALAVRNSLDFVKIMIAGAKIRAIVVPLNWRLAARELDQILKSCAPAAIFTSPSLESWVDEALMDGSAALRIDINSDAYHDWLDSAAGHPSPVGDMPGASDPCLIMYTSGSTGVPKGVVMPHATFSDLLPRIIEEQRFTSESRALQILPFFHIGGLGWLVTALMAGAYSLLNEADPRSIMEVVEREQMTHLCVVPTLLGAMLEEQRVRPRGVKSVEMIQCGGSPIPEPHLREAAGSFESSFVTLYGLSEAGGLVAHQELTPQQIFKGLDEARLLASGRPVEGVEVDVRDPVTGDSMSPGQIGEITVRSPARMLGYSGQPEQTRSVLDEDGWLRTGDLGFVDSTGLLTVKGRLKDLIISGGENIYPAEIENVLVDHPAVAYAAVVGAPHPKWVEAPVAILVAQEGKSLDVEDVRTWVRERVATYKCPREFVVLDSMPQLGGGKTNRPALRTMVSATFSESAMSGPSAP
ncbi:AMP-binding protein [Rhodococcus opacus]|nr:AMP-binding protein [Rhodococcus opacus]